MRSNKTVIKLHAPAHSQACFQLGGLPVVWCTDSISSRVACPFKPMQWSMYDPVNLLSTETAIREARFPPSRFLPHASKLPLGQPTKASAATRLGRCVRPEWYCIVPL